MASLPAVISRRDVSIGRIFARGAGALAANPGKMLLIALLCGALPGSGIARLIQPLTVSLLYPVRPEGVMSFWAINTALGTFLGAITQGAMTRVVVAHLEGRRASLGAALMSGLSVILPLLLLATLMAVAFTCGVFLLLVPGLMLLVAWSVASSALIEERGGVIDAIYRSLYLTKGARWRVLGIDLILFAIGLAVTTLLSTISLAMYRASGGATYGGFPLQFFIGLTVHSALYAFVPAVKAALYVELRDWKDGPATDNLAEVFS